MFLRVKTRPGSSRKSVQLVESVREGRKVSQRIVRHVGVAETEAELEELMELGETIDYKRNGTTTLFAALNILDGTVIGSRSDRHRHQEFIALSMLK